ncbi:type 2 lanthipeptide synthetase LanM family protein [Streptomyces sp. HD]|uniref:type 2 lanthipeptide synthetase LanM family protein n=1 Tax=Streptomyces sp. HD TaxID=3020892 RepID=UPI00232DA4E6|nr:type 2 lanthipeptide synthetase LanM family protein [Streptomyces sp. HD]MDC0773912.1 type 2 lanthipeptide synthetase LanM family protein [Streptomyces sp. HD]
MLTAALAAAAGEATPRPAHMTRLLAPFDPLMRRAARRLDRFTAALPPRPWTPAASGWASALALPALQEALLAMAGRTMALELNAARLLGELSGGDGPARFAAFCDRYEDDPAAAAELLDRYPELRREAARLSGDWGDTTAEFLARLAADWPLIGDRLRPPADPGPLTAVDLAAGDPHGGGRCVVLARFASGYRLVYKPRSLAVDAHLHDLLAWLATRGPGLQLRVPAVAEAGDHGWTEYVAAAPCRDAREVHRFYHRQGALLAVLYVLGGTDIHYENLVAAADWPVLLDLEALFHAPPAGAEDAPELLRTALLPPPAGEADLSGLAAVPGTMLPFSAVHWQDAGTDRARIVRRPATVGAGEHRPVLAGSPADPRQYAAELRAGFTAAYRALAGGRRELGALLARFADDEVRVILRATRTYGRLLDESYHPDLLRDATARATHFDRLADKIRQLPHLAPAVAAEHADLLRGDIPVFRARAGSRDVRTAGGAVLPGYLAACGLDLAQQRAAALGEADLARQTWTLASALAPPLQYGEGEPEPLVAAARAVGDRVLSLARRRGPVGLHWWGLRLTGPGSWQPGPLGPALYDGCTGIALFLTELAAVTGVERYANAARQVVDQLLRRASDPPGIGAFTGRAGLVHLLARTGVLWQGEWLLAEAERLAVRLGQVVRRDRKFDVMGGAAGALRTLLGLYRVRPSAEVLTAATRCGDHLLAHARPMPRGIGWPVPDTAGVPLGGLAHGAGGIAMTLHDLARTTGEARYATAANAALEYERSTYDSESGQWHDLRAAASDGATALDGVIATGGEAPYMTAWCHGATGIGLTRIDMCRHAADDNLAAEADAAVRATLRTGFGRDHAPCHGDAAGLELLLQASELWPERGWDSELQERTRTLLHSAGHTGLRCGSPAGLQSPELMTGLSGIGHVLLRLARPAQVPCVLTLAAPGGRP